MDIDGDFSSEKKEVILCSSETGEERTRKMSSWTKTVSIDEEIT
jgi:hypothetical protein